MDDMFKFPFYSQDLKKKKIQLGRAFTLLVKLLNVIDTDWKDTSIWLGGCSGGNMTGGNVLVSHDDDVKPPWQES